MTEGGFCLRFALMIMFEGRLVLLFKVLKVEASVMKKCWLSSTIKNSSSPWFGVLVGGLAEYCKYIMKKSIVMHMIEENTGK